MGRAKLNMELISKEKTRTATYGKRKKGLMKKAFELTTLCDVRTCMIIYDPNSHEPEIWPSNPDQVKRIIKVYKEKQSESGKKSFDLSDFFEDRKKKIEEELAKARKRNMEAKYPTWFDSMNTFSEAALREFALRLENKLEAVKNRIEFIKGNNIRNFQGPLQPLMLENEMENLNIPLIYPSIDQGHLTRQLNLNPMMMLPMSDNNPLRYNIGASCRNSTQFVPFKQERCYDPLKEGMVFNNPNPQPLMQFYGPTFQPMLPFMPYSLMPGVCSQVNEYDGGDDLHMNNQLRGRF